MNSIRIPQPPSTSSVHQRKSSQSSSQIQFSSIVPEAAKKATLDYLNFLQQQQKEKTSVSFLLSETLRLAKQGKFDESASLLLLDDSSTSIENSKNQKQETLYALCLNSTAIFCGCAPPRFDEAKKRILDAYKYSSNDTEIAQTEYNSHVIEQLEQRFKKLEQQQSSNGSVIHLWKKKHQENAQVAQDLIDTFYTIAPTTTTTTTSSSCEEVEEEQQESTSSLTENKNKMSLSPPKSNDKDKSPWRSPFLNILSNSASSSSSIVFQKNLSSLAELLLSNENAAASSSLRSKIGCCEICLLRSITFALLSIRSTNEIHLDPSLRNVFVQKENTLTFILKQKIDDAEKSCCDIPFHNIVWFHHHRQENDQDSSPTQFLRSVILAMLNNCNKQEMREYYDKLLNYLLITNDVLDVSFLKLLVPPRSSSTELKNITKQKSTVAPSSSSSSVTFLEAFHLYLRPATKLALKTHGTLHIRVAREFLFSSVTQFFYSLNVEEHEDDENDELQLLRPLSVSFDGESGIDAGHGGLTNDLLQRYAEQFETIWEKQFLSSSRTQHQIDRIEQEHGDTEVRCVAFGRMLAKCCLEEQRRVSLKYAEFFAMLCVCGGDAALWESILIENKNEEVDSRTQIVVKKILEKMVDDDGQERTETKKSTTTITTQKFDLLRQHKHDSNNNVIGDQDDEWIVTVTMGELSPEDIAIENQQLEEETLRLFSSNQKIRKLHDVILQNKKPFDAIRNGFISVIKSSLPSTLSKFLIVNAKKSSKNHDDLLMLLNSNDDDTKKNPEEFIRRKEEEILRASHLIQNLCCAGETRNADNNNSDEEISGKQIVQVLEFRGWSSSDENTSLRDSTPYYLCCWLHYQASPEMRRNFLRFATCIPNLSPELHESRIIIRRDPDRLLARTCLRTLHLPSFPTLQDLQESLEMAIHVSENVDQGMHD